jgi:hypothetical protein
MKKIEKVLSQLSNLYEFNRKLQTYKLKREKNRDKKNQREKLK